MSKLPPNIAFRQMDAQLIHCGKACGVVCNEDGEELVRCCQVCGRRFTVARMIRNGPMVTAEYEEITS